MSTRGTLFQTPTVEIDLNRYEELIKHEIQYEQYKQAADEGIKNKIEINNNVKLIESEEK